MEKPQTRFISADKLTLLPNNPRYISEKDYEALKRSIERDPGLFWCRPCLVNDASGSLIIYAGNQRYRAATELGWKEIPCTVETLTPELERQRVVIDNIQNGAFDYEVLANNYEVEELQDWGLKEIEHIVEDKEPEEVVPDKNLEYEYKIMIECDNEKDQGETLNKLNEMGIECRALIL